MPFPVEETYIQKAEAELGVDLPKSYRDKMKRENGGEIITDVDEFDLFTIFDTSSKKRIKRTATNHIVLETKNARTWTGFPDNVIAIGANGSGDVLVLKMESGKIVSDNIYVWEHETRHLKLIASDFSEF